MDSKGEVLLSILSSLAQDESRSISENCTWGIRRRFEQGKVFLTHTNFQGFDKDKEGNLVIIPEQAEVVRRIYREFLNGKGTKRIAIELEEEGVPKWNKSNRWHERCIRSILTNEKYKGDALLQKSYTVDFLTKKRVVNDGVFPQYYVKDSHPAIIDRDTWEAVQLEIKRRRSFALAHGIDKIEFSTDKRPFAGRVICGTCGKVYGRKIWNSPNPKLRRVVWQCNNKYAVKGVKGCDSRHIDEEVLYQAFVDAYNLLVENRKAFMKKWEKMKMEEDPWRRVTARRLMEMLEGAKAIKEFDSNLFYMLVEKYVVHEGGELGIVLIDGSEMRSEY